MLYNTGYNALHQCQIIPANFIKFIMIIPFTVIGTMCIILVGCCYSYSARVEGPEIFIGRAVNVATALITCLSILFINLHLFGLDIIVLNAVPKGIYWLCSSIGILGLVVFGLLVSVKCIQCWTKVYIPGKHKGAEYLVMLILWIFSCIIQMIILFFTMIKLNNQLY